MAQYFFVFLSTVLLISCSVRENNHQAGSKPNLILILTDDQGYGDLSIHGNDSLQTPNLDLLGEKGLRFDRFFVSPVCAPTRASLLTGRYHMRTGVYWVTRGAENMDPEELTLAEVFKQNGYATGCFGKWHNGAHYPYTPNAQGFDEFIGFKAGHWSNYFNTTLDKNEDTIQTEGFITDVLTDKAIDFISRNKEKPFFCYIPYNAPHTPYQVPDKYYDRLIDKLNISDTLTNKKRATIYGMCENIDDNVGRILGFLDEKGLTEKTLIIFITDNGPNGRRFNDDMRGRKGSVHEGGVRVPCFFYWKDQIKEGQLVYGPAAHIDIFPTILQLFDLSITGGRPLDGKDLTHVILNEDNNTIEDRKLFTHQNQGSRIMKYPGAVRSDNYRLVLVGESKYGLFDMNNDPGQKQDISNELPGITEKLYLDYHKWYNEVKTNASKERKIPVGYASSPVTTLPAHEALITDGLSYKANVNGWAHDWIIDWDDVADTVSWNITVVESGPYEVYLKYNCRKEHIGSRVKIEAGDQNISGTIDVSFHSEVRPHYDRVVRKVEAFEKDWELIKAGIITLDEGDSKLMVYATEIPAANVAELKGVVIKKL